MQLALDNVSQKVGPSTHLYPMSLALQPQLSYALRDRKLRQLTPLKAHAIVSANVGCIQHLQSGTATPVRHWVEIVDEALG